MTAVDIAPFGEISVTMRWRHLSTPQWKTFITADVPRPILNGRRWAAHPLLDALMNRKRCIRATLISHLGETPFGAGVCRLPDPMLGRDPYALVPRPDHLRCQRMPAAERFVVRV